MSTAPLQAGPHNPLSVTPSRAPRSVRRTWSSDMAFPDGLLGPIAVDVRGRDLYTDHELVGHVRDELAVRIVIDPEAGVTEVDGPSAGRGRLEGLKGARVRGGFTKQLVGLLPEDAARRSLCFSALEDVSAAIFVAGYARLRAGIDVYSREHAELAASFQADICAGWIADGPMITTMQAEGYIPVPLGPIAPELEHDDPDGWHEMAPLAVSSVRRRRQVDVQAPATPGGPVHAQEHFRDSYAGTDGETVMHEYLVAVAIDEAGRLGSIDVDPRVLPWRECPGAVSSAQRLVGSSLDELAARVRTDLAGPSTCTHLNSTLRTLADVNALVAYLSS